MKNRDGENLSPRSAEFALLQLFFSTNSSHRWCYLWKLNHLCFKTEALRADLFVEKRKFRKVKLRSCDMFIVIKR